MRLRKSISTLFVAVLVLGVAACGSDDDDTAADEATEAAEETESSVEELADEVTSDDDADGGTDDADADADAQDGDSAADGATVDEDFCQEVGLPYANIYMTLMGGEPGVQKALDDLEAMEPMVPDAIRDDFDVVHEGIAEADGVVELGEFTESDEYVEADQNIVDFIEETCSTAAG